MVIVMWEKEPQTSMKKFLTAIILILLCAGCLTTPTPKSGPVQTAVARQLTKDATLEPTPLPLPPVWTLVPAAISTATRMSPDIAQPTMTAFTLAPRATRTVIKTPGPEERAITYTLTGTADEVEITYVRPDGKVESGVLPLPFEKTMNFVVGSPLSLFGKVVSINGTITCQVKMGDKTLSEATITGNNKMAFCSDITVE
jgi:hypothetical protein